MVSIAEPVAAVDAVHGHGRHRVAVAVAAPERLPAGRASAGGPPLAVELPGLGGLDRSGDVVEADGLHAELAALSGAGKLQDGERRGAAQPASACEAPEALVGVDR